MKPIGSWLVCRHYKEVCVFRGWVLIVATGLALHCLPADAETSCAVGFKPETSGFMLNPILDKLTVTSAKPVKAGDICPFLVDDEILKVNQQPVPGARALAVMRYWKSIKDGVAITFLVKRGSSVITLVTR